MKTSFVIASVLLAGVALEAAAFRIDNNEYDSHKQWSSYQQAATGEGSAIGYQPYDDQFQFNEYRDQYYDQKSNYNGNKYNDKYNDKYDDKYNGKYDAENFDQYNQQPNHHGHYDGAADYAGQQRFQNENQMTVDRSAGLTAMMVAKIAAFQKIARDNDIAGPTRYLDGALALPKDAVKVPGHGHVTFQDGTITRLDAGRLQYLYVAPARDTVFAQFRFDRVLAAGQFRSDVRDAPASGRYAVTMDAVGSNATAAFDTAAAADARPARFRSADVTVRAADGTETRALDGAVEREYLPALRAAVSAEAARSAAGACPLIARMKQEISEPASASYRGDRPGKLFDMSWREDGVSVDVPAVGTAAAAVDPLRFESVAFYRGSDDAYRMRYHFAIAGLRWSAPMTVQWAAGKKATLRSVHFAVDEIDVFVTVDKSAGQQQRTCGPISVNVEVAGLRCDYDETVEPEVAAMVRDKLQRFVEHSLEKYVQESLKQELCHGHAQ